MQIQKFGIEIRKIGDMKNLYKEVDLVLSRSQIPVGSVGVNMQMQSVAHALQKMLKNDQFFSVCTVENCASVCNVIIPKERQNIYRSAHCIHWSEMLPDFRNALIAMVLDDFRGVLNPDAQ